MNRWLRPLLMLLAAIAGFKLGYDFGATIGGALAGVLLGANAAVFGALLVSGGSDLLRRLRR